jgi:hypothetical protein
MQLLPLDALGPREVEPGQVRFGLFLPWVSAADGNQLSVKMIHESDQFLQVSSSVPHRFTSECLAGGQQNECYLARKFVADGYDR